MILKRFIRPRNPCKESSNKLLWESSNRINITSTLDTKGEISVLVSLFWDRIKKFYLFIRRSNPFAIFRFFALASLRFCFRFPVFWHLSHLLSWHLIHDCHPSGLLLKCCLPYNILLKCCVWKPLCGTDETLVEGCFTFFRKSIQFHTVTNN